MKRLKAQKCEMIAESVTECDQYVLDDKELKYLLQCRNFLLIIMEIPYCTE